MAINKSLKLVLDIGPIILFFAAYKLSDLYVATALLIGTTLITFAITYVIEKKVPWMLLFTAILVAVMGGLTIVLHDDTFIKMKPTFINLLFAAILFAGYVAGKGLLRYVFAGSITMSDDAWKIFSLRWALFFVFVAIINECVWRLFDTDTWVNFKVFGLITLTMVFLATQMPFLKKHMDSQQ